MRTVASLSWSSANTRTVRTLAGLQEELKFTKKYICTLYSTLFNVTYSKDTAIVKEDGKRLVWRAHSGCYCFKKLAKSLKVVTNEK
jgi:hypothetical protein